MDKEKIKKDLKDCRVIFFVKDRFFSVKGNGPNGKRNGPNEKSIENKKIYVIM